MNPDCWRVAGGRVVTWGRGTSGQLGHGEAANNLQPKAIEALGGFVITHVSAGWNHSGFVSDNGNLFTCGDGTFGQLGLGDYLSRSSPVEVSYLSAKHVKQIACGMRHSLALIKGESGDRVFGFGSGKRGQLGISDDKVKSVAIPQVTLGLENVKINAIIANGDHSAAICADGHLYTWGRSFGSDSDMYMPRCLTVSSSFCSAALGWNHALALTGDGEVFMIGGYKIKQTSEDAGNGEIVKKIDALDGIKVLQISSGAEHSALVTGKYLTRFENEKSRFSTFYKSMHWLLVYRLTYVDDGSVMTWGWGEHGQLGFGDTNDEAGPRVVSLSHEHTKKPSIAKVYCGSGFTFVVKKHAG
nr:ultraviolet-B receptor UVR8 isoform X2 [Ipomoea batatas]